MTVQWTGSGPEVLLHIDRSSAETLGSQLQRELRNAIREGRLGYGEKLPSSRRLAAELGVSRGLVVDTYTQLEAEGYLSTQPGSATRVSIEPVDATPGSPIESVGPELSVDFAYGVPDLNSFPMHDWLWALREAARTMPISSLGYGDPRGLESVRSVIASYLRRIRGSLAAPDNVIVTSGYTQGLNVVLGFLAREGKKLIAIEDPCEPLNPQSIHRHGLSPVPVPVDERGIDVAALAATEADVVIVTPAHQCPTGTLLSPERRHQLIDWAKGRDGLIIEDDYDVEYRYDRQPVGSLHGLAPDHVIAFGSVSKSLAPFMRLGWAVTPGWLTNDVAAQKKIADRATSGLDQAALAELIRSGRYDRHLRRMRGVYARRRKTLIDAVAKYAPACQVSGLAAGLHAVVHAPDDIEEAAVVAGAREVSVGIQGMSDYRFDASDRPTQFVLGFGNLNPASISRGISAIGHLLVGGQGPTN